MNNYQVKLKTADVNTDKFFLAPGFSGLSAEIVKRSVNVVLNLNRNLLKLFVNLVQRRK
jgi:chemotaxis regulatin CheY-phosphate phosphatase CheZ